MPPQTCTAAVTPCCASNALPYAASVWVDATTGTPSFLSRILIHAGFFDPPPAVCTCKYCNLSPQLLIYCIAPNGSACDNIRLLRTSLPVQMISGSKQQLADSDTDLQQLSCHWGSSTKYILFDAIRHYLSERCCTQLIEQVICSSFNICHPFQHAMQKLDVRFCTTTSTNHCCDCC